MKIRFTLARHLVATLALASSLAHADGLQALEQFLRGTQGGKAAFIQTVTTPARSGETAARSKASSGTFEFLRPNRFRFHYAKPFEQTIVADGKTLWLHDVDLNQVTARPQEQALGGTPAGLIASATDLRTLQTYFKLSALPDRDGAQWVQAQPLNREAQLQSMSLGFRNGQLSELDMLDSFGQRSVLRFLNFEANGALKAESFRFTPPAGADVIKP